MGSLMSTSLTNQLFKIYAHLLLIHYRIQKSHLNEFFFLLIFTAMSAIAIKECMTRHLLVEIQDTYGTQPDICLTEGSLHCDENYPCCEGLNCNKRVGVCQKSDSAQNMLVAQPNITSSQHNKQP